jgi:hypothetical protein
MLMFAIVIVMQRSVAVCPMVVYLLMHLIHFVFGTKTVDTCLYTWMVSGIFDLAKFAFSFFASIISFHYYIIFNTRKLIKLLSAGLLPRLREE